MTGLKTHQCPGKCGREVASARYACVPCWSRLPQSHRVAIIDTSHLGTLEARRRDALVAAGAWFRDNPTPEQIERP